MNRNMYKVIPDADGRWRVENGETNRTSGVLPSKEQALVRAESLAIAVEPSLVRIFRADGSIEDERWYHGRLGHVTGDSGKIA